MKVAWASLVVASIGWAAEIVPDGFDSAALAAAVARSAQGDTVRLAAGTYQLTEPLRPRTGTTLRGAGQDQTVLVWRGSRTDVPVLLNSVEEVELADFTVDGENTGKVGQGMAGSNSRRLRLHHLTIRNVAPTGGWGPHGILFSGVNPTCERGVTDSIISDCTFRNIGIGAEYGGAVRLCWGSVRNTVTRCTVDGTGRGGIFGDHSPELTITHNTVRGSCGEGLGIEIWGGCPRSVIEDNQVDHWLSVDGGHQSAVRRNRVGADDGSLKFLGIEIIAQNVVVTDNTVSRGCQIGLSVSNKPANRNVFWGYNTVRESNQWGAQFQGEDGGCSRHYFYRNRFEGALARAAGAIYPGDSGHGFRFNSRCRDFVFDDCDFTGNGGYGVQLGGRELDGISFRRCRLSDNKGPVVSGGAGIERLEFVDCQVSGNGSDRLPADRPFAADAPRAAFTLPKTARVGQSVAFECQSVASAGTIEQRLWDLGHGIAEVAERPVHTYDRSGEYRVTLVVWDSAGRAGHAEQMLTVLP